MLKHLMSGASLISIALRDGENDTGADAKTKLREQIAKGNLPEGTKLPDPKENDETKEVDVEDEEGNEDEEDEEENEENTELTPEQIKEKELAEKIAAKAKRKEDRIQKRFNDLTAAKTAAETEVARLKAQLEADPDKKLTAEEINTKAEEIANAKLADKQLKEIQAKFTEDCDKLQAAATKTDPNFYENILDITDQLGPIPSFMIGVLSDLDNGADVIAHIAKDDTIAEDIWSRSPAIMTKKLVKLSNELEAAKKAAGKKQISKVPDPVTPVKGARTNGSTVITEADTKNMDVYAAKRRAQMAERRKQGYN